MECESIKINIPLFLGERLSPDERREIVHHIEACARCRQEMKELERVWSLMDRWEIEEPSAKIKTRLMATVSEELQDAHIHWWINLQRSFTFQTVVGALGLSMIIYIILPFHKVIYLCETNIVNAGTLAFFPKGLIYFVIGMLYGLVPISVSEICFSRYIAGHSVIKGLGAGSIFAALLVSFFIVQCLEFTTGLIFIMVMGIIAGSLSGGTGTFWLLRRFKTEAI